MPKTRAKIDFKQFQKLAKDFEKLVEKEIHEFSINLVKELAARLLAQVRERTPVFDPPAFDMVTKGGGRLRDSWEIGEVTKAGDIYSVELFNPLAHASYVEKGHRGVAIYITASVAKGGNHIGWRVMHKDTHWTEGRFMLKNSEDELNQQIERIVENKLKKFLNDALPSFKG